MIVLFVTSHPYLPQLHGGMQSSTNELCSALMARGHRVSVLAGLMPTGSTGLIGRIKIQINKRLVHRQVSRGAFSGYVVWRTWFPWEVLEYVANRERPDLIVVMAGDPVRMAMAAKQAGIPILMRLLNVERHLHGGRFEDLGDVPCVANSRFTANIYHNAYGVNPTVIYPSISPEKYKVRSSRENVTFINPDLSKGCDIALGVASLCPDIPFTFVESWQLSPAYRRELTDKLATLHNVTLLPPQDDMHKVYGKCKILLAPSIYEEAYGRVATEAQFSGIPVVASRRGGLPEAVGPGGIILDTERTIADWAAALRDLWWDHRLYTEISAAAVTYANREEMSFDYQVDAWERAMLAVTAASALKAR